MKTGIKSFDPAEWLEDDEMIAEYLRLAFESGDIRETVRALNDVARARNMTDLAKKMGISRQGLYKTLSETGHPEFSTILKLVSALGLKLSVLPPTKLTATT